MANIPDRDKRRIVVPSLAIFVIVILGAAFLTYSTREWNAAGNHQTGTANGNAPSEGGPPPLLNRPAKP
jgi:hypothetical protein